MPHRQEVLNVALADLLIRREVVAGPENIFTRDGVRQMPDVIVQYQGLRLAIEGEIAAPGARERARLSAIRRVESGIAHMGMGVIYPQALRDTDFSQLRGEMEAARLDVVVVSEAGDGGYESGDIDYLENLLRRVFERLLREDVVAEAVAMIDVAVDEFARMAMSGAGNYGRIIKALGRIRDFKELDKLSNEEKTASCRVGGLVLLNAMIFHEVLTQKYPEVTSLRFLDNPEGRLKLHKIWQHILDEINFISIFSLSSEIYLSVSAATPGFGRTTNEMMKTAIRISEMRAALNHDLMGRVYHRLLSDAKYLGTYYTSLAAATMLLKLALRPQGWSTDWAELKQVKKLKIADLACGTGTLLVAAADAVLDNHVSSAVAAGERAQLDTMHQALTEQILHGYDVLASAIHLTASNLALRNPDVPFQKMNLFVMPYGDGDRLGTLEFLGRDVTQVSIDMAGAIEQFSNRGRKKLATKLPQMDLCVMNPPFVRSVGGNLLFGSMPAAKRTRMRNRLRKFLPKNDASISSGLGAVFVALAERHTGEGSRLALVLPKALLSGVSWQKTRNLINTWFQIDYIIVSHDAQRWNFSESTSLSEALLVATRKLRVAEDHKTRIVNLWRNPTTVIEALPLVNQIQCEEVPDLGANHGVANLTLGGEKAAEMLAVEWSTLKQDWFLPCAFAQSDLTRMAFRLRRGEVWLPTLTGPTAIGLCPLDELGILGPDRRNIYDNFDAVDAPTPFAAFWGHDSDAVIQMAQTSNRWLQPRTKARKGGTLGNPPSIWELGGTILLAEGPRLNTARLLAICTDSKVLSNVWWTFALLHKFTRLNADKTLALWFNSSLGLLNLLTMRTETEGAWVNFKKSTLRTMSVLDIRKLSDTQLAQLAAAYDELCERELQPLPRMAEDETRAAIDSALSEVLGLPDLAPLREMLAREPVVCMQRL
ncbi:MAG: N-6 DNA methylase [Anaerolineaceae bacterium]|nr:N-6 DNA methylase [Anaerolineaceae bacterium]